MLLFKGLCQRLGAGLGCGASLRFAKSSTRPLLERPLVEPLMRAEELLD